MERVLLALTIVFMLTAVAFAQPYCEVRTFSVRNGLAANIVSGFAQTRDGLMWFSTWNGLCYYDGYRFTPFRNRPGNDVLTINRIKICKPSATGSVWCITSDSHVYLFNTKDCHFVNVSELIARKYGRDMLVRGVYPLSNGYTWIVDDACKVCVRIEDKRIVEEGDCNVELFGHEWNNLPNDMVKKVVLDSEGREWVLMSKKAYLRGGSMACEAPVEYIASMGGKVYLATTDGHIYSLGKKDRKPVLVALPDGVSRINGLSTLDEATLLAATDKGVAVIDRRGGCRLVSVQSPAQSSPVATSIYVDTKKRVWTYTGGNGIVMVDSRTWQSSWLMALSANVAERTTSIEPFFHEDGSGTVWVVPSGGTFSYYSEHGKKLVPYRLNSPTHPNESLPIINKCFSDADRNLWFTSNTSDRDVCLANFGYHHFRFLPVLYNQETRSVFVDSKGRTWVGTYDGQVALFDADYHLLGFLGRDGRLHSSPVTFAARVYSICEEASGRMWIGTKGQGLFAVDLGCKVSQYLHDSADRYSLSNDEVYDVDIDSRGNVWVASFGGGLNLVTRDKQERVKFVNVNNDLRQYPKDKFLRVRRITHTNRGEVIVSTTSGLLTFSDRFKSPENIRFYENVHRHGDNAGLTGVCVLQAVATHDGRVFVITLGGGIQQVETDGVLSDRLAFHKLDGDIIDSEGMLVSAVEDNNGDIWGVCGTNILCYKREGDGVLQYAPNTTDGYLEITEAEPAHNPITDAVLLCVRGGVVCFTPDNLALSDSKPKIAFTSVQYQGDHSPEPVLGCDVLDVPSDSRNFTVYFSALEYGDRFLVKYAYKVEGVDDDWNYVGANNSVSFNHLPAGRHKLLVKSTNRDGVWVDNVAVLNIYTHPTFWETGWAWLLYVVAFCGIVVLVAYIYTLRARNMMVREMGEMKMKFFTEIGHKLRTPLTLIGGPVAEVLKTDGLVGSARKHLEMVQRNASQMLELVNRMLKYNGGDDTYISDDNVPAQKEETNADISLIEEEAVDKSVRLLVVEDNDDLRAFLVDILGCGYTVLQAVNGKEGLEIAERSMPDFIITDVMMPVMDGLAMVHLIKQNKDICHIPIIVLSAKASLEDRLQGLREGIDDYITKPFSAVYLKSRVNNIISSRRALQQTYVEQIKADDTQTYKLESPQIVDADNEMMKRLLSFLDEHISDASLRVEDCADAVNLGRSAFYSKLKSIVGMTPVDFVSHIRMQRAVELVVKSNYTFSQIAYMVGFSDPKYFSRSFKCKIGKTPSEYRKAMAGEKPSASDIPS